MSKTGLIIKREYLYRIRKRSFLLLTFLMPFLVAAVVFVPLRLASIKGNEVHAVAVIDATGKYAPLFEDTETYRFIRQDGKSIEDYRTDPGKELFAVLHITADLLEQPQAAALYSEKQVPEDLVRLVSHTIRTRLEADKLATFNIPDLKEIIAESKVAFDVQTIKWSSDGTEKVSSSQVASVVGTISTFLIYMFILIYGAMVMQGVMEEKTSRIVELMISSVRPFELMMGKIIGIGCLGLTQLFLWGVMTAGLLAAGSFIYMGDFGLNVGNLAMLSSINFAETGSWFIIFFIGGYMLYASVFAAIGSAVDSQEDTHQFMTPVTFLMVFALYTGMHSLKNPDGPLAFWCSMIPFTSPIVMMVRIPFEVPLWEKLLSVLILYASFTGITWLSAKIYRVGILMYGKKPDLREMIKWIRFK
ncbi:ABC transporter permease [Bacteroidales bacterium Barb7]|nr:ABC transporter permease [Bacteroidales bacterium Barb7]